MSTSAGRISAAIYLGVSLAVTYILLGSSVAIQDPGLADLPLLLVVGLHFLWGVVLLASSIGHRSFQRVRYRRLLFVPEILAAVSLLFFLFSFIFALNANMDYVQRFIQSGGNLRLALDTRTERLLVWIRVFPLVVLDLGTWLLFRIGRPGLVRAATNDRSQRPDLIVRPWSLALVLASAFLQTISLPSFLSLDGYPLLGWIAYVPLFMVLRSARFGQGVFYGMTFGVYSTLLSSYWLGTFSLVSLQITVLFFLIYYAIFTPIALLAHRHVRFGRVLVFPLAFTVFEYLRSIGFLGYPWALTAHSQYSVVPLLQMVEVTGVWGLSLLVLLANSAIAEFLGAAVDRFSAKRTSLHPRPLHAVRRGFGWLVGVAGLVGAVMLAGTVVLAANVEPDPESRTVTVAQIQQNNDPRKSDYERTLETLVDLTNQTRGSEPDLVVWSETAFVPNIRRWSQDDSVRRFHRLVNEFLEYQRALETWLVTGNDDYEVIRDAEGAEVERYNYNAAVLFDANGDRRETYRKIRLVPFTEYFPYRDLLPGVYDLLLEFDVNFWEPGRELTVFEHPLVRFSTPICYEDVFPGYVRRLVLAGSELILNISNDYWSLTEVQAKQHFVAGLFRSVENRRPILRTTSSGLTGWIDPFGRIVATAPYFSEAVLISEVPVGADQRITFYTRHGDWFPLAAALGLLVLVGGSLVPRLRGPSGRARRPRRVRKAPPRDRKTRTPRRDAAKRRRKINWKEIWNDE